MANMSYNCEVLCCDHTNLTCTQPTCGNGYQVSSGQDDVPAYPSFKPPQACRILRIWPNSPSTSQHMCVAGKKGRTSDYNEMACTQPTFGNVVKLYVIKMEALTFQTSNCLREAAALALDGVKRHPIEWSATQVTLLKCGLLESCR